MIERNDTDLQGDGLSRYLSPVGVWALSFGCAVGWGAFIMPGTTFLPKAGPMGTVLGMILGTVLMLIIGYNYHYMMSRYGGSGGAFTYARETFGEDHGFLCAWFLVLTYVAILWANTTALVLIFRNLAGNVWQVGFHYQIAGYDVYFGELVVSITVVLVLGAICIQHKSFAGALQTGMALILFMGIMFCLAFVNVKAGGQKGLEPWFAPHGSPLIQVLQVTALVPWAFVGFESISNSTGEFRFPAKKTFGIMAAAVVSAGLAYTLLVWLGASVQPEGFENWSSYVDSLGRMDGLKSYPTFFAVDAGLGRLGVVILGLMLLGAVGTGIVGNYIAASRLLYAMAGEGLLPQKFHTLNKHGSPEKCLLLIMIVSAFIPFIGRTAVAWIVDVTSVGATVAYGYTSAAAFMRARKEGDRRAEWAGGLGVLISLFFFTLALVPNLWSVETMAAESYLILVLWSVVGLICFRFVVVNDEAQRFGKSTVVWLINMFLLFFVSAIWMRQAIHAEVEPILDSKLVHDLIHMSLTRNSLIQIGICLIGMLVLFSIFAAMGRRERKMEVERAQAQRANTAKSEFLASMSHEIRTPINAVLGMNEMIIRESRDKRITTYARNVESAGKNLLSIINDILDFSKIEAGKMEIVDTDYRFSSVLNDVTNMIVFKAKQKNLQFNVDVDETLPDGLKGDPVRLRQAVVNILNNAVKYTHEGSVSLRVSGERAGEVLNLVFQVEDTGIGIKQEDIPKLFGKFQRVDLQKNSTVEGTGLGLSITKNLVEMMGGTVSVKSEYGKGSVFTIRLPQKVVVDEPIGDFHQKFEQYVRSLRAYRESFRAPEARLLVVDDTPMNLTVVEGLLAKTEIKIDTASSGAEALGLTAKVPYDLILMDQRMPLMGGTETLNRIRKQIGGPNAKTPVICLTADAVSGAKTKYLEEGFSDYLSKPIEAERLEEALVKFLPTEKVILSQETEGGPVEAAAKDMTALEAFYAAVPELNYGDAMRFCANENILRKTLEQFYRAIKPNANAIDGFLMEKDYKNYTIKVHALKSSARLIGAGELSADARYLEDLGNSLTTEDMARIEELTPKLLA
ncbi:MAG: amino acid permease, partial [Synergistaceae bacterium]|nr:amino acid permease [Synergistaceae bacterium]